MLRLLSLLVLAGCGAVNYPQAVAGRFDGALFVMWVNETQGDAGDGKFVFVPSKTPLTFTRMNADGSKGQVITPGMMYTDGGSIPLVAQVFHGFAPWGYAPAYMVHDWLFEAHRCVTDQMATPQEQEVANVGFPDSAVILAEAIKGLIAQQKVKADDVAPPIISSAVAGPTAQQLWNEQGTCKASRISADDLDQIRRAFPGLVDVHGLRALQAGPKATIVATVSF